MPRPKPFDNFSSAVATNHLDQQVLTPRTPHSHFENHRTVQDQYGDDHGDAEHQTIPLLSGDNDHNDGDHFPPKDTPKSRRLRSMTSFVDVPLILGTLFACFLFGLLVFSYKNPGRLQEYIGAKTLAPSPVADEVAYIPPPIPPPEAPLHPSQYVTQCREMNKGFMTHGDYWDQPHMNMGSDQVAEEEAPGDLYKLPEGGRTTICSKTITYLLDGEVGLLADLALIAQAAALARERNRTFIIDDTYWNRGRWTDHFESHLPLEPGPEPGCRAPHPKQLVACPRTARHWVITAHTAKYHFGHAFNEHYENPYGHNLNRRRPIYNAAHESFISTIRPNTDLGALIRAARHELLEKSSLQEPSLHPTYLAAHVRRGDRKLKITSLDPPYIPVSEYTTAIETTFHRLLNTIDSSVIFLASDSPSAERELSNSYNGQYFSLRTSQNPGLRELASPQEYDQKIFNALSEEEKVKLTKGMIVDFALLSGVWAWKGDPIPGASICTISSNICKMTAVGLGWERAFGEVDEMGYLDEKRKGWVELEEKGNIVPVWSAFELL